MEFPLFYIATGAGVMAAGIILVSYAMVNPSFSILIAAMLDKAEKIIEKLTTRHYRQPVPYTKTRGSVLPSGFYMVCMEDKTATEFPAGNALECWELFAGIPHSDPDFKTLISYYESTGWRCIHSINNRG